MLDTEQFNQIEKEALATAKMVTASPLEWYEQNVTMARFCLEANQRLALWQWLTDLRLTVELETETEPQQWVVLDVNAEELGRGDTPELAIVKAVKRFPK